MPAGDGKLGSISFANHLGDIPMCQRHVVRSEGRNWQPLWKRIPATADDVIAGVVKNEWPDASQTYSLGTATVEATANHPQRFEGSILKDGHQRPQTAKVE